MGWFSKVKSGLGKAGGYFKDLPGRWWPWRHCGAGADWRLAAGLGLRVPWTLQPVRSVLGVVPGLAAVA